MQFQEKKEEKQRDGIKKNAYMLKKINMFGAERDYPESAEITYLLDFRSPFGVTMHSMIN